MTSIRLAIAVAVLSLVLLIVGPAACQKIRSLGLEKRVAQEQLDAHGASAVDAIDTAGNVSAVERAADDLTRSNEKEIRNAQGADTRLDPDAQRAGLRALCRRPSYRDSERCRLLEPGAR